MIKKFVLLLIILSFGVNSGLGMYDIGYDGYFITTGSSPERELDTLYYTNESSIVLLVNMGISEYVNVSNYHWISLKVNDIWTYTRYTDFKTDDYKYHYETGWFSIYFIIPSNSSYILVTNDNSDDTYYIDEWFEFPLLPTESIIYQNVTNDNKNYILIIILMFGIIFFMRSFTIAQAFNAFASSLAIMMFEMQSISEQTLIIIIMFNFLILSLLLIESRRHS